MQDREQDSASISRRKLVAGAALGAGALLGVPGVASAARRAPSFNLGSHERRLDSKLAPGMYGGPTGFKGAERYQYPLDSEEGRAISALRAMKKAGNGARHDRRADARLRASRSSRRRIPKGALSITSQFYKETGIKIKFTVTTPADEYATNTRNASSRNSSFDAVTFAIEEMGDFAEAKLLKPLDAYVAKYKPMWNDPKLGFAGGQNTVNLFSKYNGTLLRRRVRQRHAAVLLPRRPDGRPERAEGLRGQVRQEAARAGDVGRARADLGVLHPPGQADVRRHRDATPRSGAPSTGTSASSARPRRTTSTSSRTDRPTSTPRRASARSRRCSSSCEYHEPGSLEKDWVAQYKVMGAGNGFMGPSFPNLTKILPGNPDFDTANVGQHIRTGLMPGRNVGGKLVRRPVIFYNISYGVNAHVSANRQLAAYLFLQWAGASKIVHLADVQPRRVSGSAPQGVVHAIRT